MTRCKRCVKRLLTPAIVAQAVREMVTGSQAAAKDHCEKNGPKAQYPYQAGWLETTLGAFAESMTFYCGCASAVPKGKRPVPKQWSTCSKGHEVKWPEGEVMPERCNRCGSMVRIPRADGAA